jgi:hypothetical protein
MLYIRLRSSASIFPSIARYDRFAAQFAHNIFGKALLSIKDNSLTIP